ncbi:MAG: molybdopterin molybdotransferase MoeA [Pseudomonadales bacterium]|nr:molybdopterin molybdotransferase MoeA [Pseudomonadales bacterium]MDP6471688.1 molybdopterin molybdotransferase MoeA [Pseudomonadales bacterium]MDP6972202.1 molybdopterin molybdotransferase MoeA [Pseudomonadales bacterium]
MHVIQPLELNEALKRVLEQMPGPKGAELVSLNEAGGRVAATDITAPVSLPPFPNSAMDGYAFDGADNRMQFDIVGSSLAGHPFKGSVGPGQSVRITTGGAMPAATDTVAIQENCTVTGNTLTVDQPYTRGANVRPVGNDITAGHTLISRGNVISAFDVGWLAACGIAEVEVFTRPLVAVFSTGDELQEPGTDLRHGNIYDSNRWAIAELLKQLPVTVKNVGVLPDDSDQTRQLIERSAETSDALITSGGVSVGDADFVKDVIEQLGSLQFWRLKLKPGKPVAFGKLGDCALFGLPGNPVSTIVTYLLIARPALLRLAGCRSPSEPRMMATLEGMLKHSPGREEYQRGTFSVRDGINRVASTGNQGSHRLATFANANCLIRIPLETGDVEDGEQVEILPFSGILSP